MMKLKLGLPAQQSDAVSTNLQLYMYTSFVLKASSTLKLVACVYLVM